MLLGKKRLSKASGGFLACRGPCLWRRRQCAPPARPVHSASSALEESLAMTTASPASPSTCDLCDAHKSDDSGAFRVLPPGFHSYGGVAAFSGEVHTIKCFEDNSLVKAAVESPGRGRVLVVDGGASLRRALVGGNLAASAARNGWAGIVVNGC